MYSNAFQGFMDLAFIVGSFCVAFLLAGETEMLFHIDMPFARTLVLVSVIQLAVFSLSGLHKSTFRQLAMGDLLKVLKTCAAAAIVSWIGVLLSPQSWHSYNANVIILDFYVLLSLVLGSRVSFHILNYLSRVEKQNGGRHVLIYGAHPKGMAIVQTILNDDHIHLKPMGFLDEDPRLEGKRLNGYPIFGGHWKLPRLLRKMTINEIILAEDSVHPEIMQRMIEATRGHGIIIRTFKVSLEDIHEEHDRTPALQEEFAFIKQQPTTSRP
jgi:FlaA1/EpsC-like NDP-sugar epimerase